MAGLPSKAELDVVLREKSELGDQVVTIALQLPPPERRLMGKFDSSLTFWQFIKKLESDAGVNLTKRESPNHTYLQLTITFMSRELSTNSELRTRSLFSLGLITGNKLLKASFVDTNVPFDQFLAQDLQKEEEDQSKYLKEIELREQEVQKSQKEISAKIDRERLNIEAIKRGEEKQKKLDDERRREQDKPTPEVEFNFEEQQKLLAVGREVKNAVEEEEWSLEKAQAYNAAQAESRAILRKRHMILEAAEKESVEREIENFGSRNIQAFKPSAKPFNPKSIDIPESWYDVSVQDLAGVVNKNNKDQEQIFKPKSVRKKEFEQKFSKFKRCLVNVRFPDKFEIQIQFHPKEPVSTLYEALKPCLLNPDADWYLYSAPPMTKVDPKSSKTFMKMRFVPACILHFGHPDGAMSGPYLLPEFIEGATEREKDFSLDERAKYVTQDAADELSIKVIREAMDVEEEEVKEVKKTEEKEKEKVLKKPSWFKA
eukprot:TRINITY_DN4417_c0_g1_i1.p1 TRINITY_DN4417_c0_g1~~TRINITY_DN4417_c0_g1_i1.p1  ORF type:complete len:550 (+),score=127.34 TRINITY_DN4417_c0_g1_i1:193-1650(+)